MLVLTRYLHDKLYIGDDIAITIVETRGRKVRLGIHAPAKVKVVRGELLNKPNTKKKEGEK
jgi:carbon storage regulator